MPGHKCSGALAHALGEAAVVQKLDDGIRESARIVGNQQIVPVANRQAFGPDRRRDHCRSHRHRLEDSSLRVAAVS
jgi:hypothetical protein